MLKILSIGFALICTTLALLTELTATSVHAQRMQKAQTIAHQLADASSSMAITNTPALQKWVAKAQAVNTLTELAIMHDGEILAKSSIHNNINIDKNMAKIPLHREISSSAMQISIIYPIILNEDKENRYDILLTFQAENPYSRLRLWLMFSGTAFCVIGLVLALSQLKQGRHARFTGKMNAENQSLSGIDNTLDATPSLTQKHDSAAPITQEMLSQRITEATEALHARAEKAEIERAAKSRLLAAASHDLRQPMHALLLFISELDQHIHTPTNRHLVQRIAASAEAMSRLLDSLLDISKLDTGVVKPTIQPFPLYPTIQRIVAEQQPYAEALHLRLKTRATSYWVSSDPVLFERIISNLVNNAIRYTHKGSIFVGCRRRGDTVHVEVRDSGVGIPNESLEAIFEEFIQLDHPEKPANQELGLGLGLAIVRRLANLLGHPLNTRSLPGCGSVFTIILPLAPPVSPPSDAEQDRTETTLEHLLIALIDDDPLARLSMESLLRSWGCSVLAAASLEALLDTLAQNNLTPDMLIADFLLQGESGNGLDVIQCVRQKTRPDLPAVLISGDTASDTLKRAQAANIPLLHKPVRPARLRALIQRLHTQHEEIH